MERAAYLETLLEAVPAGVVVVEGGRISDVNPAICELTGFDRAELVGAELPRPLIAPEDADRLLRYVRDLGEAGRADAEMTMVRKDGTRFTAMVAARAAEGVGHVLVVSDISHLRRREARLAELAAKDQLTGLLNKRSFLVNLAGEVARARRHRRPLSLAVLDLDGFKRVNDAAGHPAGDRVLAEAAGRLGALVRSGEHLARVGGDEFGWILPDADTEGASSAITRARAAIASEGFRGAGTLSLSGGICVTDGSLDAAEVYHRADRALYRAKAEGAGRIVVVD